MPDPNTMLIHSQQAEGVGRLIEVTPESAGWEYVGLVVQVIPPGGTWHYAAEKDELCIVPLRGSATITSGDDEWTVSRPGTVFDGKPTSLYLPVGSTFTAVSGEGAELAVTLSRAEKQFPAKLIEPDDVDVEIRGAGNAARQINHIIKPEFPADKLLVVEVFTPSGNWSSFPPHKHDVSQMPAEADLEEIYYYRINPDDGFGLQRLYFADGSFDHAWVIKDGDLLLVPEGYHAFAVAHGYTGYYLNILAGDEAERTMQPADDPAYAWVRSTWDDSMNEGLSSYQDIDDRINGDAGKRKAQ
ncbi:MAG TPA: 5-deoxy-glucuronate isomerase [Thermomicrobiales bacterium]|nr:5-deoxy-glucuronate isomerase [Thermomicrobiales bacterium]